MDHADEIVVKKQSRLVPSSASPSAPVGGFGLEPVWRAGRAEPLWRMSLWWFRYAAQSDVLTLCFLLALGELV